MYLQLDEDGKKARKISWMPLRLKWNNSKTHFTISLGVPEYVHLKSSTYIPHFLFFGFNEIHSHSVYGGAAVVQYYGKFQE